MNVHIATAGEKPPVEAAFNFIDMLGSIDKLYIVTGEGNKEKFKDIRSDAETKVIEVNPFNFEAVVSCLVGIYRAENLDPRKDKLYMNLTGGTNILSVAAYVVSLFLGINYYYLLREGPIIFEHTYKLSDKDKDTIKLFEKTGHVFKTKGNSRPLNSLEKRGIVNFSSKIRELKDDIRKEDLDKLKIPEIKKRQNVDIKGKYAYLTPEGKFFLGILKESNWKL